MAFVNPLDQEPSFKQEEIPTPPQEQINITPIPGGSVVENGNLQSANYSNKKTGWSIDSQGNAEFNSGVFRGDFVIGGLSRTIDSSGNIQTNLDQINAEGGGSLYLKAGTYTLTSSGLTLYSSTALIGISPKNTVLNFNSTSGSLNISGSSVYSTGTITGISGSVNVTGSGTLWLTNVTAGQSLFIGTRWYTIAAVTGNTTLILSEGYGDNVTFPSSYRIATVKNNVLVENIGVKNSTGNGITLSDARQITIRNVQTYNNSIGISYTNCSEIDKNRLISFSNTSHGVSATNLGLCNWSSVNAPANSGNGFTLNNFKTFTLFGCSSDGNTGSGFNLTSGVDGSMLIEAVGNGGKGFEFVSGNSNCDIYSSSLSSNTSDGIKLTATTDSCHFFGCDIANNGGYGVNIAASTNDNNILTTNYFSGNSSGAVNDSGTLTIIRGNSGVDDNAANSRLTVDVQTFSTAGLTTWTMPTNASTVLVQAWAGGGGGGGAGSAAGNTSGGGGGGAYTERTFVASGITSTVAVTVGAGGSGGIGANNGTAGGNSSFGSYLTIYGGGAGSGNAAGGGAGGGGGGIRSVGANASVLTPGNGGDPIGGTSTVNTSNFGGGYGNGRAGESVYGGGGGNTSETRGGNSIYGGGGGGSVATVGGTSIYGGNGGTANGANSNGSNGIQPAGGGAGAYSNAGGSFNGGNGGDGKVIITTIS